MEAYRWTKNGGMVGLGDLPGGAFNSQALGVSGNGSVIIGLSSTNTGEEAMAWDFVNRMRSIQDILDGLGVDVSDWELTEARGISADGTTIVGTGFNPDGNKEVWIAVIPELYDVGAAVWNVDASGEWNNPTNWNIDAMPDLLDQAVEFSSAITSNRDVTLGIDSKVGRIIFDNVAASYQITGTGLLTIDGLIHETIIRTDAGDHEISVPIAVIDNIALEVSKSASLRISRSFNARDNVTIAKTGLGLVQFSDILNLGTNSRFVINDGVTAIGNVDSSGIGATIEVAAGGRLVIGGTVAADILNSGGSIAPGSTLGLLAVDGDYTQDEFGSLEIELGGISPGMDYDQVIITGESNLDGKIDVLLANGFVPQFNDTFTVLTAKAITGMPDTNLPALPGIFALEFEIAESQAVISVTATLLFGDGNNDGLVTGMDIVTV